MSDIMISASLAEGLPNSVLEGLACGLPILFSDITPHQEIYYRDTAIENCFLMIRSSIWSKPYRKHLNGI